MRIKLRSSCTTDRLHSTLIKDEGLSEEHVVFDNDKPISEPQRGNRVPTPTPRSPSRLSRKRSRSFSRTRSTSASGSRGILNIIASGMKAASELFHKDPPPKEDVKPMQSSPTRGKERSTSPRKVRFESETSPVDIPKSNIPALPPIDLPGVPFMDALGHTDNDAIPTGRPPDTPVLKGLSKDDYFSPLPSRQATNNTCEDAVTSSIGENGDHEVDPFADPATVEETGVDDQKLLPFTSNERPPLPPQTDIDEVQRRASIIRENPAAAKAFEQLFGKDVLLRVPKDPFTDAAESDIFSQRKLRTDATHEDIRHRFRSRPSRDVSDGFLSPASDSSNPPTPLETCDVAFTDEVSDDDTEVKSSRNSKATQSTGSDSEVSAMRQDLELMSLTDPVKVCHRIPSYNALS